MWITRLKDNEVFVFGSNYAGRHGKGAAKQALSFGARYGVGEGLKGRTYGIPTKDNSLRVLPLDRIKKHVDKFIEFAISRPDLIFLVTEIGTGLAGYKIKQIAPLFKGIPSNVKCSERFKRYL